MLKHEKKIQDILQKFGNFVIQQESMKLSLIPTKLLKIEESENEDDDEEDASSDEDENEQDGTSGEDEDEQDGFSDEDEQDQESSEEKGITIYIMQLYLCNYFYLFFRTNHYTG